MFPPRVKQPWTNQLQLTDTLLFHDTSRVAFDPRTDAPGSLCCGGPDPTHMPATAKVLSSSSGRKGLIVVSCILHNTSFCISIPHAAPTKLIML